MAFTIETGLERPETPTSIDSVGPTDSISSTDTKTEHVAIGCFTVLRAKLSLTYAKFKLARFSFYDRISLANYFSSLHHDAMYIPLPFPRKNLNAFLYHEITRLVCPELTNISSDTNQISFLDNLLKHVAKLDLNAIGLDHAPLNPNLFSPKILEKELAKKFSHFLVEVKGEKDPRGKFYESYTASFFHPLNGQLLWTQKWVPYKSMTVELSSALFRKA